MNSLSPFELTHDPGVANKILVASRQAGERSGVLECSLLKSRGILNCGLMDTSVVLQDLLERRCVGSFFLCSLSGAGYLDFGSETLTLPTRFACLAPGEKLVNFGKVDGREWRFLWVGFAGDALSARSQLATEAYDPTPLHHAMEGLFAEMRQEGPDMAAVGNWISLIGNYSLKLGGPRVVDSRVAKAWEIVSARLDWQWTLESIARLVHVSEEHFRRLNHKALGESPMKHLARLRMAKAAEMLSNSGQTLETIANSIGYENQYSFSNSFLKWHGMRPSVYRQNGETWSGK